MEFTVGEMFYKLTYFKKMKSWKKIKNLIIKINF